MAIDVTIEAELDRLERDPSFRADVTALRAGQYAWGKGRDGLPAYRRYSLAIERFVDEPETMRRILADPMLKIWFLRVFGYRGEAQFTIRPGVWLRELPLLDIGRDAHLGYGMVLGTSRITGDGTSLVLAPIRIGEGAMFHQHAVVEGGTVVGARCRFGIRAIVGADCRIAEDVMLGDLVQIGEGALIGAGAQIGAGALVGANAIVDAGVTVAEGDEVPAQHRLTAGGLFPRPHRTMAA